MSTKAITIKETYAFAPSPVTNLKSEVTAREEANRWARMIAGWGYEVEVKENIDDRILGRPLRLEISVAHPLRPVGALFSWSTTTEPMFKGDRRRTRRFVYAYANENRRRSLREALWLLAVNRPAQPKEEK